jgi:ASC-1-like (ASCH) protein
MKQDWQLPLWHELRDPMQRGEKDLEARVAYPDKVGKMQPGDEILFTCKDGNIRVEILKIVATFRSAAELLAGMDMDVLEHLVPFHMQRQIRERASQIWNPVDAMEHGIKVMHIVTLDEQGQRVREPVRNYKKKKGRIIIPKLK